MKIFRFICLLAFSICVFAQSEAQKVNPTPPVHCLDSPNGEPMFNADFLYWTARQEGLEYAAQGVGLNILGLITIPTNPGEIQQLNWDWNPGFKIGFGWNLPHDGWDVYSRYTWFHTHPDASYVSSTLTPYSLGNAAYDFFFNAGASIGFPMSASSDWEFQLHVVDLELARHFHYSKYLTFRPFFGFKGAGIFENFTTTYVSTIEQIRIDRDEDYWAIGMRIGADSTWFFAKNWGIFGNISASAMWSYYNLKRKDTNNEAGVETILLDTKENLHTLKPVLEMVIGLHYQLMFSKGYQFSFNAGWEGQIWSAHNHFMEPAAPGPIGNLILQGLRASFRFDF